MGRDLEHSRIVRGGGSAVRQLQDSMAEQDRRNEQRVSAYFGHPTGPVTDNYQAQPEEFVLCLPPTAGITVTLPRGAPELVGMFVVVKNSGDTDNDITVRAVGGGTVNGQGTFVIDLPYGSSALAYAGTDQSGEDIWYTANLQRTPAFGCVYVTVPAGVALTNGSAPILGLTGATTALSSINKDFDSPSVGRLRYTGAVTKKFSCKMSVSASRTAGATSTASFYFAKNDTFSAPTESQRKLSTSDVGNASVFGQFELATNDYIEMYMKSVGANMTVQIETASPMIAEEI